MSVFITLASVLVRCLPVDTFAAKVAPAPTKALVAPKTALSAYFLWLGDNRERIAKKLGTNKASEVAKAAGAEWKDVKDAAKAKYQKKNADLKATYEKELAAFTANGGVVEKRTKAVKSKTVATQKTKDPNAPKRPLSSYMLWLAENRAGIVKSLPSGSKPTEVMKAAGAKWSELKDPAKKKYVALQQKAQKEYEQAKAKYEATK